MPTASFPAQFRQDSFKRSAPAFRNTAATDPMRLAAKTNIIEDIGVFMSGSPIR